jgi:YD repeat-containing protein
MAATVVGAVLPAMPVHAATSTPDRSGRSVAYQVDATHDGRLTVGGPTPPLVKRWSRTLGGPSSYPVIADGKVFVTAADGNGSYGTSLHAFDAGTGADAWGPIPLGGTYFWSALTYGDGAVYTVNFDGVMRAFEAATGRQRWIVRLPGQYSFSSAPTYAHGIVYVGGAGSGGTLYAASALTGRVLWTQSVMNGDQSSPAVTDDGVYVSYACENVYDFDPQHGTPVWTSFGPCEGGGGRTPVVAGGLVWVRDDAGMGPVALDAATGHLALSYSSTTAPAFDDSQGYFREGDVLVARDVHTQAPHWTFTGDSPLSSAPIVVGNHVYVGSSAGTLYAIDRTTGAAVWSGSVGAAIFSPDEHNVSSPSNGLAAGNGLLVVPADKLLVAYGSASGPPPAPPSPVSFGWGWNALGAVGDSSTVDRHARVTVATPARLTNVAGGFYDSLGVASDGTVRAWGWNGVGQLGDGTTTDHLAPVTVPGLTNVTAVSAGAFHSLALRADGTVWAWGWNALGQLGDGTTTDRHLPVQVPGLTNVVAISAGTYHSLALRADGTVLAWGWNGVGQLGDGTTTDHRLPAPVHGLSHVTSIDAGAYHSLAVGSDGTAYAWGWNAYGQLGDGTTTDRNLPVAVAHGTHAVQAAGGIADSLVLADDGTVSAAGWNGVGAVGDGTTIDRHSFTPVVGLRGVTSVDAGGYHDLAVTDDGTVWAWGWNALGQLGDGTTTDRHQPVPVPNVYGATAVSAGVAHSLTT